MMENITKVQKAQLTTYELRNPLPLHSNVRTREAPKTPNGRESDQEQAVFRTLSNREQQKKRSAETTGSNWVLNPPTRKAPTNKPTTTCRATWRSSSNDAQNELVSPSIGNARFSWPRETARPSRVANPHTGTRYPCDPRRRRAPRSIPFKRALIAGTPFLSAFRRNTPAR